MDAEIVSLVGQRSLHKSEILRSIEGVVAILTAIQCGEMLAALPDCEIARSQHGAALTLLAMAERELHSLYDALVRPNGLT